MSRNERFDGINRLYGKETTHILGKLHVCVIGLGGVGSWSAEALARSGIGNITLIDYDDISESNINRQIHATSSTLGNKKIDVLRNRILDINPDAVCNTIDDFINNDNLHEYLSRFDYDYVIDAIDSIIYKAAIIYYCRRNKIAVITTGGAGGVTRPETIMVKDLTRSYNDALAARVRSLLRKEYGYSKNPKRYFGVECVFSSQKKLYPDRDGCVSTSKPGIHGVHLDCSMGYGSASYITATFGFAAAARVINKTLIRLSEKNNKTVRN
ncbi:MAG TPA: tRNA cyclic N6-threonylcarbamoyladenosine(37) synthase TcdA [Gammaproteobacteria bacterium]|nr:tRNA cyclic N6-threonylcarbamoyladenosine(37) synthase TcdA [Gammaproteobacteria bacterium]